MAETFVNQIASNQQKKIVCITSKMGSIAAVFHPGWVKTDRGGPNALITTQESVAGMRQVIEQLTSAQSGKFYAYDGQEIPW